MSKHIYTALLVIIFAQFAKAQNPTTYVFPSPDAPPPNLSVDSYTRATTSINLKSVSVNSVQTNFKYGFVTGGATKLLNLSISSNPSFVGSGYLGSAINPQVDACTNNPPPDEGKPLGETGGNFMVSATGAAVYSIPILVSPGTMGVEPKLSVTYNSQSGISLLGNGVSLSGLSTITRTSKTPMLDGKFAGVDLTYGDVFELDGNRLLLTSTTTAAYGLSGASYYTENESFAVITSNGSQVNGPQSLQVKDKNGNVLDYGGTADSRLTGVGDNTVLSWYLNKITDEYGNYMLYTYTQLSGELVLDKIEYTGNTAAGLAPYNTVKFEYMPLAEKNSFYIGGKEFKKTQLLKSITSLSGTNLVKKYVFDYNWVNKGTYLASVKEIDANGSELNPTNFCWADPSEFLGTKDVQDALVLPSTYTNVAELNPISADLNGDGFSDYVCIYPGGAIGYRDFRSIVLMNDFKTNYGTSTTTVMFSELQDNYTDYNSQANVLLSANVTDENNDNKQEVYTILDNTFSANLTTHASNKYEILRTELGTIYGSPACVTTTVAAITTPSYYDFFFRPSQFYYDTGDHDGDAINDALRIDPFSINLTTALGTASFAISTGSTIVRPISFNSDANTDYLILENVSPAVVNLSVISLSVNPSNQQIFNQVYSQSISFPNNLLLGGSAKRKILTQFGFGDLNGDGLSDIVYMNVDRDALFVLKGTGTGFLPAQQVSEFTALSAAQNVVYNLDVVDLDGDGKDDINITDNIAQLKTNPSSNYFTYYSLGDMIVKGVSYSGNWKSNGTYNTVRKGKKNAIKDFLNLTEYSMEYVNYNDLNGDGVVDITSYYTPGGTDYIVANNAANSRTKYAISKIVTPLRKNLEIHYGNLNVEFFVGFLGFKEELYKKQSTTTYTAPLYNYKPAMYCVNNVYETSGFSGQFSGGKKYIYSDAIMHNKGNGFLGFEQVLSYDNQFTNFIASIETNSFNTTFNIPVSVQTLNQKIAPYFNSVNLLTYSLSTPIISKTSYSTTVVPRNSQGYFVSVNQITEKDYLKSTAAVTNYTYNLANSGNISAKSTVYGWPANPVIKTELSSYTYILQNGYYKPLNQTQTQLQTGSTSYVRSTDYFYDAQGRLITTINDQANPNLSNKQLITGYSQYNAFGAPTAFSVSAGDVSTRPSQVLYDPTGRFVIKKTNAIGNFEEYTYDPKFGVVTEAKDITGLSTKYVYDGLGRLTKTILPTNAVNKITYAWDTPGSTYPYETNRFGVYSVKTEIEGSAYNKTYYSSNGEVLREESLDYAGQVVVKDTKYATNKSYFNQYPDGLIMETTEPHYIGQPKYLINRYDYETTFYRPIGQTTYSLNSGAAVYTGIYNQTTYSSLSTDLTYTPAVISSINQNNQQVIKKANAAGQLVKLSNYSTASQQSTLYNYHSNGQPSDITLIRENGGAALNILHSFVYNDLGQKTQLIDPSLGTISYTYNTLGEVVKETKPNGSFIYAYDNLGRLTTRTGSVSGTTTYQYVSGGNGKQQLSKILGLNSTSDFTYDAFNRLSQNKETVLATNKILTTNYVYDAYGREVQHTYPSGFISKNVYNGQGHLSAITNSANANLWQLVSKDALGRIREYNYGNGINTKNTYNDLNYLTIINHGNGGIHK